MVMIIDLIVVVIGVVNIVVFDDSGFYGFNIDYSGFKWVYCSVMGNIVLGIVCLIGMGGVGKVVVFGLIDFGVDVLWLVDLDLVKVEVLVEVLRLLVGMIKIVIGIDVVVVVE